MKFAVAALLATLTTTCFAQGANLGSPANGTSITPGQNLVVQINRPDSLTGSTELGVVIGILSCNNGTCLPPGTALGTVLFNGPFDPVFPPFPNTGPPQENYTVTIPPTLGLGPAGLSVFHTALVGDSNEPLAQTFSVILDVV